MRLNHDLSHRPGFSTNDFTVKFSVPVIVYKRVARKLKSSTIDYTFKVFTLCAPLCSKEICGALFVTFGN